MFCLFDGRGRWGSLETIKVTVDLSPVKVLRSQHPTCEQALEGPVSQTHADHLPTAPLIREQMQTNRQSVTSLKNMSPVPAERWGEAGRGFNHSQAPNQEGASSVSVPPTPETEPEIRPVLYSTSLTPASRTNKRGMNTRLKALVQVLRTTGFAPC